MITQSRDVSSGRKSRRTVKYKVIRNKKRSGSRIGAYMVWSACFYHHHPHPPHPPPPHHAGQRKPLLHVILNLHLGYDIYCWLRGSDDHYIIMLMASCMYDHTPAHLHSTQYYSFPYSITLSLSLPLFCFLLLIPHSSIHLIYLILIFCFIVHCFSATL